MTGVYTAWLFAQAKGRSWSRDKWLTAKMSFETLVAGFAGTLILTATVTANDMLNWIIAIIMCSWVIIHGHKAVREPQLETLH